MWWLLPAGFVAYLLLRKNKDNATLSGISQENIYTNKVINLDEKDLTGAKSAITRFINNIANDSKVNGFKIGKSGQPSLRSHGYDYNAMILLAKSTDKELIKELEKIYNSKYIGHPKNENINEGSAGKMETLDGYYYLYIVIR